MGKVAVWLWRTVLGAVMFAAGVGPKDVDSNISAWLSLLGMEGAASATQHLVIDSALIWACAVLIAASFLPAVSEKLPRTLTIPFSNEERFSKLLQAARSSKQSISFALTHEFHMRDAVLEGASALLSFRKAGFTVPNLSDDMKEKAFELTDYFSTMIPLLEAQHWKEAKSYSSTISSRIESDTLELRDAK